MASSAANVSPALDVPLVDTHAHIFERGLPLTDGALHEPEYDFKLDDYLALLDSNGIAFGVIAAPGFLGTYNDYMIRAIRSTRRLKGTAIIDPDIHMYTLRRMDEDGIVGIRLAWKGVRDLPDLRSAEYRMLFRRIRDLDWHVHIHVEGARLAPALEPLAAAGVKLVVDHFGRPDGAGLESPGFQALLKTMQNGRTWVKLSAPYRLGGVDPVPLVRRLLAEVGAECLLWGSDCPWMDHEHAVQYPQTVQWLQQWIPDPTDRKIISHNALKLYHFI